MKVKTLVFSIVLSLAFGCASSTSTFIKGEEMDTTVLNSLDGPYIYSDKDSLKIISVEQRKSKSFFINTAKVKESKNQKFTSKINNSDNDQFAFALNKEYGIPDAIYDSGNKILVTSDIEGNFNTFYSLLRGNGVMDKNYNWTYGNGHLVICGDMFDRGTEVLPSLWLLYKLEKEAKKSGGMVHFILGNHDVMNLYLDIRYVNEKYIGLARIISGIEDNDKKAYRYLMSEKNELVKWIKTKNAVEKIGNNLFLHGGISEELINAELSISDINTVVRKNLEHGPIKKPTDDEVSKLVFGNKGPFWYRGLIKDRKNKYEKINEAALDRILDFYAVEHIIIGHTIVSDEVTEDFDGKVIRVDIKHPKEKFTGKSQALLIEKGKYYKVNDVGIKEKMTF
ncbi:metallophosphoesterase [Flagellimonas sp. HMM57]|uniref:metallophosphoesterase n=1 Tax=unclassified Flagellimonas TaxID=2644544 RepID=UPI0013CFA69F|nr:MULTISPECIES: metallophosphoesterase [unclassified Flagellimonas]UII76185.1 metallophosphoesterase [Flagellimonas sp. HMM57]